MATRRRFLAWTGLVLTAGVAATLGRGPLRRWLLSAGVGPEPTGPLRDSTADTLGASVRALLDDRVELSHYLEFFRWRALHVPGALALYERFEAAVDGAARRDGARGFRAAGRARQRRILEDLLPARGVEQARRMLLDRDQARFARHVVREIFRRFARTDAWVRAGYDGWPGMPRAIASLGGPGPGR